MDYLKKLDELRDRMRRKAEETDRRYNISSKVEDAVRQAESAARVGADAARAGIDAARRQAEQIPIDPKIRSQAREAASAATDAAKAATDTVVTGARVARDQAVDFFG